MWVVEPLEAISRGCRGTDVRHLELSLPGPCSSPSADIVLGAFLLYTSDVRSVMCDPATGSKAKCV
jgi:hypothetical protein